MNMMDPLFSGFSFVWVSGEERYSIEFSVNLCDDSALNCFVFMGAFVLCGDTPRALGRATAWPSLYDDSALNCFVLWEASFCAEILRVLWAALPLGRRFTMTQR
jgi:hypothetical protein